LGCQQSAELLIRDFEAHHDGNTSDFRVSCIATGVTLKMADRQWKASGTVWGLEE